jgi:hypothetical protein
VGGFKVNWSRSAGAIAKLSKRAGSMVGVYGGKVSCCRGILAVMICYPVRLPGRQNPCSLTLSYIQRLHQYVRRMFNCVGSVFLQSRMRMGWSIFT